LSFKKGNIPWNKGKPGYHVHSEEHKKMLHNKMKIANHLPSGRRGSGNYNWRGGSRISESGYRVIYVGGDIVGKRNQFEHRVVAEKALGRTLGKNEVVHHINGDKLDNRNSNLLICSIAYHKCLENQMAYLYKREHFNHV